MSRPRYSKYTGPKQRCANCTQRAMVRIITDGRVVCWHCYNAIVTTK